MAPWRFQYRLSDLLLLVACVALVLGAVLGELVRLVLFVASLMTLGIAVFVLVGLGVVALGALAEAVVRWVYWMSRLPFRLRQLLFERRWARLRPGQPSERVRGLLGIPRRVDGFGDRLYWSYRVAGRRYTVSFDPRNLVARYSNGLARDLPRPITS